VCLSATKKQMLPAEQNAPAPNNPSINRMLRGSACHSIAPKPTIAITIPERKARLSGDSVRVKTRDQTMFTEKQLTQIMHAAKPTQSPCRDAPKGFTAITTPANPTTMANDRRTPIFSPKKIAAKKSDNHRRQKNKDVKQR